MSLQSLAISTLLGLSTLLGVQSVAPERGGWTVTQDWQESEPGNPGSSMRLTSESTEIVASCRAQPDSYLVFPPVVHGSQQVSLDGQPIFSFGDPSFLTVRSFYGAPVLRCRDVSQGSKLTWTAFSYTKYFARISFFPKIAAQRPLYNVFAESFHIVGAGSGLMMAIFVFVIFAGKMNRQTTLSVGLASLFSSIYLGGCVAGFMGLPLSMLAAHKTADVGVWMAMALLVRALHFEDLVSKTWMRIYFSAVLLAIILIVFGNTGDVVQFGTMIPFGLTLTVLSVPMLKLGHGLMTGKTTALRWMQFFSLGSFVLAAFNEMFVVTGLIHTSPMLPFGFMGAILFLALAVNVRIGATYQERDYLRGNLESEVKSQTAKLEKALLDLKATQAELVQSAKLAALGTLSAGIAHEINNSLNYVNGALQPLEKIVVQSASPQNLEKIGKLFGVMKDGLHLTLEIIKGLRTYTGLNQAKFNDVNLATVVNSSLVILRSRIRGKVQVVCDIPPELKVFGMVVGLNQIFMNLISNALDAMTDGGTLQIRGRSENQAVIVSVQDSGQGMPAELVERIFEPFFTTKDVGQGTGLGLHIVKQEIDRHGGLVRVISQPGKGTTFEITLPAQPSAEVAA